SSSFHEVIRDRSRRCGVSSGRPMDVEPVIHALPELRGFLQLATDIDAGDLALVQVVNEGGVESHLVCYIAYPEVPPSALVLLVDRVAERNIDHQEPYPARAHHSSEVTVDLHRFAHFWEHRAEVRQYRHLTSRSRYRATFFAGPCQDCI